MAQQAGAGGRVQVICPGHSRPVPNLSFSPIIPDYGSFLISACLDGMPMLRDGQSGDWIGTFQGHKGATWSAKLNPSATLALSASADFTAKLWDAVTGKCLNTYQHKHIVKSVAFSADSDAFFTAGHEKIVRVFDVERPEAESREEMRAPAEVNRPLTHLVPSLHDSNTFVTAWDGANVHVWDRRTGEVVKSMQTGAAVSSIQLSHDGEVLSCAAGSTVTFWSMQNFELIKQFNIPNKLLCVALDPSCTHFVTGSQDELWVRQWDYRTGQLVSVRNGHHGPVRCAQFHPDGLSFASGSEDGTIRLWVTDPKLAQQYMEGRQ